VVVFVAYLAAFRGKYLAGFFRNRFITAVGGMCYTIYLYHSQMIWWVKRWFEEQVFGDVVIGHTGPALAKLGVVSLAIVAISAVMYVLFEKPFMRRDWHKRWFRRHAPVKPAAAVDVSPG
jgi:peptidoglycan/LPS O-acetylase OafA/YrhL